MRIDLVGLSNEFDVRFDAKEEQKVQGRCAGQSVQGKKDPSKVSGVECHLPLPCCRGGKQGRKSTLCAPEC